MESISAEYIIQSAFGIYNHYVLIIMGIFFEILGALFLTIESIGIERFSKTYNLLRKFSKWSKKSWTRMNLIASPFFILLIIGFIFRIKTIIGLTIPLLTVLFLYSFLTDSTDNVEYWITKKVKERTISPIGFVMILIGNLLQLISVIWQMSK